MRRPGAILRRAVLQASMRAAVAGNGQASAGRRRQAGELPCRRGRREQRIEGVEQVGLQAPAGAAAADGNEALNRWQVLRPGGQQLQAGAEEAGLDVVWRGGGAGGCLEAAHCLAHGGAAAAAVNRVTRQRSVADRSRAQHAQRVRGQPLLLVGGGCLPETVPCKDQGADLLGTPDAHCSREMQVCGADGRSTMCLRGCTSSTVTTPTPCACTECAAGAAAPTPQPRLTRQAGRQRLDFEGQQLGGVVVARQQLAPRPSKQAGLPAVHLGMVLQQAGEGQTGREGG